MPSPHPFGRTGMRIDLGRWLPRALFMLLAIGLAAVNGSDFSIVVEDNYTSVTNAQTTPEYLTGKLDAVVVKGPTAWTGTVAIATAGDGETLITTPSATQTNVYRPRNYAVHNASGASVSLTNVVERYYISDNRITTTVTSTSTASTNDVTVLLRFER